MNIETRYINVFDKSGNFIAQFSNNTSANTDDAKKNLMASPTPHIVSNGESTLSFEMVASSEKWQQIKNPENIYECGGRYFTALNANSIVYNNKTVSVTLVETWYLLKKVFVQAHNVDTKIEALDEHTVKILPKTDKKFKLTVNGVSYDDSEVRDSRGVIMPRGSAGYALWAILKGTDWSLGVCDVLPDGFDAATDYGTFNVETDMKSALENIQFIQSLYGGILDWDSKNKVLNLRDETKSGTDFNTWKGFEIRKGKNIASDPTVTWDNDIITRLYPLGNGNLNIRKVNGGKSYVENFSYTDRVYDGYLQNANIYDTGNESGQKTLKFWAERKLEKLSRPRKSIEYNDIIDLRAVPGHEFETFDVNDVVKAYYTDDITGKEVSEFVRVQEVSYNYFFPSSGSTVVVGDKVANEAEIFHQVYKRVESSTPTDQNGNISSDNVYIEIPDWMLPDFGYGSEFGDSYGYGTGYTSLSSITELHAYYEKQNKDDIVKTEAAVQVVADDLSAQQIAFTTFQKETADKFVQSSTQISQVSTDLKAQIELEANHYKETSAGITESNGKISIIADSLSAQIALEASHYRENSNSIASLRSYADSTFATNSLLASYETKSGVDNKISRSEASIKQYATNNFARVEIRADVDSIKEKTNGFNNVAGFVKVDAGSVTLGVERRGIAIAITPTWTVLYGTTTVSGSIDLGGDARINGKKISVDSRGFLKAN